MPLPSNPETVDVGAQLVDILHKVFGPQPGFRPGKKTSSLQQKLMTQIPSNLHTMQHTQKDS